MNTLRSALLAAIIGLTVCSSLSITAQTIPFSANRVRITEQSGKLTVFGIETPNGAMGDFELQRCLSAVDEKSTMLVAGKVNDKRIFPSEVTSYIGGIKSDPGSTVILTYVGSSLYGIAQESTGQTWVLTHQVGSSIYQVSDETTTFTPLSCGVSDYRAKPFSSFSKVQAANDLRELELAVETDVEFYRNTGGTDSGAVNYLTALVSTISALYQREFGIVVKLVWAKVWTEANPDPYKVQGNPFALSDAIKANWNSYDTIQRDLFHAITASAGGGGGFAYPNSVCSDDWIAHGASSVQGWSGFDNPVFNYDTYIVAHEIGHNFGAQHTHSCFYGVPLDTCEVDEGIQGGCLANGTTRRPNPGSIMSYCGWINLESGSGYQVRMQFHPVVKDVIQSNIATFDCLSPVILPIPTPLTPNQDTLTQNDVEFTWTPTWTNSYDIEIRGDMSLTETSQSSSIALTLQNGSYEWRVRSNTVGGKSEWSDWIPFTVRRSLPIPIQLFPKGDTVNVGDVTFQWSTSWDGLTELELRGDTNWSTTITGTQSTNPFVKGLFEWRLRSIDGTVNGEWTDWAQFVVRSTPLPTVSLIAPVNDTVATGKILFTWESSWNGEFEFALRGDSTTSVIVSETILELSLSQGSYEWRVRAIDGNNTGDWSEWRPFRASDNISSVDSQIKKSSLLNLW